MLQSCLWEISSIFFFSSWGSDAVPLIGPESGICAGQNIFQFGAKLIQLNGEPGEAIVELVVCGHGAWQGKEATQTNVPWKLPLHLKWPLKQLSCEVQLCVDEEPVPTWPPDAFGRRWDTTVKALVPFSKKPVDHFPLLIHHKPLNLVHVGTPVVSLKDKYHVVSFPLQHLECNYGEKANFTLKYHSKAMTAVHLHHM